MHVESNMTHYMELLASNQPWNLILFMAIPVILAEFIAVSELYILYKRETPDNTLVKLNGIASIVVGIYFSIIFLYLLFTTAIPLTMMGGWRGPADIIAVGFYLLGVVPLLAIALLSLGIVGRRMNSTQRLGWHAAFVGVFLVVAHVAMIFGMLNPQLLV